MGHPHQPNPHNHRPGGPVPPPGGPYPGQQGPYPGQQPQYGQQPYPPGQQQFGAPGGYGGPPPRSGGNGGKIALIIGGVAVVLIAVGAGAFFLFGGDGGGVVGGGYDDPREVAQAWVDQKGDPEDLVCAADMDEISKYEQENPTKPTGVPDSDLPASTTTLKSVDVPAGSDSGTFTMEIAVEVMGTETTSTMTYDLVNEDGWKVCGILDPDIEMDSGFGLDGP